MENMYIKKSDNILLKWSNYKEKQESDYHKTWESSYFCEEEAINDWGEHKGSFRVPAAFTSCPDSSFMGVFFVINHVTSQGNSDF